MSCDDCHNPHGTLTNPLLKTNTVNETCYQCHAEKRGPFLFEHAPVRENCLNCHTPHGSNQSTLLVAPIPFLCQQCHTNFLHPNDLQTRQALGTGSNPDERIMGRGCLTCHANIHGSNAPSGVRFLRVVREELKMRARIMRKLKLIALAPLLSVPVFGWADSGVGVDTWRANKLDPTGGQATEALDPDGTRKLARARGSIARRRETCMGLPRQSRIPETLSVCSQIYGDLSMSGYLHTTGDKTALYDRFTRAGLPAVRRSTSTSTPSGRPTAAYAEARGSRISAEDQYYEAVYGKAGAYRAEIFVRDMPNLLSTDAKSIFNGAGTNNLTLAGGLVPGGSTQAQVAAVSAAATGNVAQRDRAQQAGHRTLGLYHVALDRVPERKR